MTCARIYDISHASFLRSTHFYTFFALGIILSLIFKLFFPEKNDKIRCDGGTKKACDTYAHLENYKPKTNEKNEITVYAITIYHC